MVSSGHCIPNMVTCITARQPICSRAPLGACSQGLARARPVLHCHKSVATSQATLLLAVSAGASAGLYKSCDLSQSAEPNIKRHHHDESDDGPPGTQLRVATVVIRGAGLEEGAMITIRVVGCGIHITPTRYASRGSPASLPFVILGDDVVQHHVNHGTRRECQGVPAIKLSPARPKQNLSQLR